MTILRLLFLPISLVFLSYFFGYDLVLLPRFFGYDLVFLRIGQFYDSYFFGYDNSTTPISSDTTSYFRRISSDTTILRLVFIPYILHTGILRLVFLLIPVVILQYYFVFEILKLVFLPRNMSMPSVFEFWGVCSVWFGKCFRSGLLIILV